MTSDELKLTAIYEATSFAKGTNRLYYFREIADAVRKKIEEYPGMEAEVKEVTAYLVKRVK